MYPEISLACQIGICLYRCTCAFQFHRSVSISQGVTLIWGHSQATPTATPFNYLAFSVHLFHALMSLLHMKKCYLFSSGVKRWMHIPHPEAVLRPEAFTHCSYIFDKGGMRQRVEFIISQKAECLIWQWPSLSWALTPYSRVIPLLCIVREKRLSCG